MTSLYIVLGGIAIFGLLIWLGFRDARRAGGEKQRADDIALAKEVEAQIHDIQAETRDTQETLDRLKKGDF